MPEDAAELEAGAEPTYEVVWPLSRSTTQPVAMSHGPGLLEGARIGFVWDYVFRGDEIFAVLVEELAQRYPTMTFSGHERFGNIHGHDEREVVAALGARCREEGLDAAVVAVGA